MASVQGCLFLALAGPHMPRAMYPSVKVQVKPYGPEAFSGVPSESSPDEKGVITLLQEFVQTSPSFRIPQGMPALQWNYDVKLTKTSKSRFRARLAFLLDGIPHHVLGAWDSSKKNAQRELADSCLKFFIGAWSALLLQEGSMQVLKPVTPEHGCVRMEACVDTIFSQYCQSFLGAPPSWSVEVECPTGESASIGYKALVQLQLLGVPHTFAGRLCRTPQDAKTDTAKRVLWYLQCPGFEDLFELDPDAFECRDKLPMPSPQWSPWKLQSQPNFPAEPGHSSTRLSGW